jgi:NAD(P)-dependent dehydrogenase (short-subunit alcohol dehydrogenase family)
MKILIFGGAGGLGTLIHKLLEDNEDYQVKALNSIEADVVDLPQIRQVIQSYDPDVILNFAVYNFDGSIHKLEKAEVDKQIDVNVKGAINVLQSAIEPMRAKKFGRIIFLSSVLSTNPVFGTSIYSATKGFIDNLVKTAAIENVKYGITVNSIQLGYFEAGLIDKVPKDVLEEITNKIPFKRLGKVDELWNALEFIIKTEYFTGVNLPLSGGLNISSL